MKQKLKFISVLFGCIVILVYVLAFDFDFTAAKADFTRIKDAILYTEAANDSMVSDNIYYYPDLVGVGQEPDIDSAWVDTTPDTIELVGANRKIRGLDRRLHKRYWQNVVVANDWASAGSLYFGFKVVVGQEDSNAAQDSLSVMYNMMLPPGLTWALAKETLIDTIYFKASSGTCNWIVSGTRIMIRQESNR